MAKTHSKKTKIRKLRFVLLLLAILILTISPGLIDSTLYYGRIHPGVKITGIDVGGLKPEEAASLITGRVSPPTQIKLLSSERSFNLNTDDINLSYDFTRSSERAYQVTRTGNILGDLAFRADLYFHTKDFGLTTKIDPDKLNKFISLISAQISEESVKPSIKITGGTVNVTNGVPGQDVDGLLLSSQIGHELSFAESGDIEIPLIKTGVMLDESQLADVKERASGYLGKSLTINFENTNYKFNDVKLVTLLNPLGSFDETEINSFLDKIEKELNRPPQNPKFEFNGGRVTAFQPALDGISVDRESLKSQFENTLADIEKSDQKDFSFDVPVVRTPPEVSTDKVNDLGVKEVIGRGVSTYYHSIPSRVHNVVLAATRVNGILVKPGDTFSFNDALGDVSQFTGYQQAYIISGGKTILGDGGGVCQVSTTLFRALLNAGLPINERQAHAYRVGYYEQNSPPGLDATVYGPSPDLKFTNNTPGYILIEATANPRNSSLVFELYGTSDGRVSTISKPSISDVSPPPPDLYQDDSTLPAGTIKQIDFKAWGAKVIFNYKVTRGGDVLINKTFTSNYRPWQAVYLRGPAPAN